MTTDGPAFPGQPEWDGNEFVTVPEDAAFQGTIEPLESSVATTQQSITEDERDHWRTQFDLYLAKWKEAERKRAFWKEEARREVINKDYWFNQAESMRKKVLEAVEITYHWEDRYDEACKERDYWKAKCKGTTEKLHE